MPTGLSTGELQVLLGRCGSVGDVSDDPEFKKKTKWGRRWNIPKGHVEGGESLTTAALREFKEETSLEINPTRHSDLKYLGMNRTSSGKEVHIFAYECDFAPKDASGNPTYKVPIKSNLCDVEENGVHYQVPEMAEAYYWKITAAERMIFSYQIPFLTALKKIVESGGSDEEIHEQADGGAAVADADDGDGGTGITTTDVFGPETDEPTIPAVSDKDKEANASKPVNITNIMVPAFRGYAFPMFRRYLPPFMAPPRPASRKKSKKKRKKKK